MVEFDSVQGHDFFIAAATTLGRSNLLWGWLALKTL